MSMLLRSTRFAQLRDLAKEGNVEAVGDLWREFGFQMEGIGMSPSAGNLLANKTATSDR